VSVRKSGIELALVHPVTWTSELAPVGLRGCRKGKEVERRNTKMLRKAVFRPWENKDGVTGCVLPHPSWCQPDPETDTIHGRVRGLCGVR